MSQKRFTRSSTLAIRNNHKRQNKSKQQAELSEKVREAIADHKFNQALSLINSVPLENHWTTCQRAHVLFQMGRISRSLNAVRNALKIQRKNCTECLVLLLKIIDRRSPNFHPFLTDITNCLNTQGIPQELKAQYQNRKSQIHIKEQPRSESTKEDRQKFKDMTSYYQKKGLMFKKVQIVEIDQEYRVARAKSAIKANEIIIFVPEKEMITLELAKSMTEINKLSQQQVKLKSPKHCMLSVFLLIHMELGQNSPYFNYIQCLPRKLHNFPIYYSDQLIEELKGTSFAILIRRKKSDLSEDFKQVTLILPQLKQVITYEKFVWARMIVSSRIFGVIINQKKTDALVPIADMLNHKIPKMTSWYFCDQRKGFIVRNAEQQIPKGHQIFDSYGYKCNSRFLLNYGFTIPQNAYNQVMIAFKKKRSVKISAPNIKLSTSINSDQFKIMLAYFRHCVLQKNQSNSVEPNQIRKKVSNFLSNDNQCETWKLVQQTIKQQLQQYKTTIKMDEKILRSSEVLSFNLRNCIQIRLGEKRVLDFYARMSNKMIQYFTRKRKNVEIKVYEAYLREIQKNLGHLGE